MRCLKARKYFSSLRKYLAHILYEKGLTQSEIAELLGVSQPAVSNYLRGKRGIKYLDELEKKKDLIMQMADEMVKNKLKFDDVICKYCPKLFD